MHISVSGKWKSLLVSSFSLSHKSLSTKQCRKVYPCHFMTLRILIYFEKEQSRFLLTFLLWFNWMIFQKTFPLVFKQNYYDFVLVQTTNIHVLEEERNRWRKTRKYVSCFRLKKGPENVFQVFLFGKRLMWDKLQKVKMINRFVSLRIKVSLKFNKMDLL